MIRLQYNPHIVHNYSHCLKIQKNLRNNIRKKVKLTINMILILFLPAPEQNFCIKHQLWVKKVKQNENSWTYVTNCRKCQNITNTTRAYLLPFIVIKLDVIIPTDIYHHTYRHYRSLLDFMSLSSIPMLGFGLPITSFIAACSYIFHPSASAIFNSISNATITTCLQNHLLFHTWIIRTVCARTISELKKNDVQDLGQQSNYENKNMTKVLMWTDRQKLVRTESFA